ncbi:hypothetical protein [Mycolicibacterium brisbanense]|uniref:Uncharacterized protein n=1 Tax=Mycolicibacterium brisbanense TaxID=146020 RepID=A0A100W1A7_9MYCO|nr:hypothetical protein [Mycolicibacterium brisbanense]MCV7160003.1 hypothetical protein [Mycolicibacterium brisbanense]GAS89817.1 putative uncharacterized protein [Mycolicibacterium brisbanense]
MASTKYIGYVGGVAVAMGVGAAIATAGQGTANADATDGGSAAKDAGTSTSVNAGPKRTPAGPAKALSKINDNVAKVSAQVTKTAHTVSTSLSDSLAKPAAQPVTKVGSKPAPSAADFEAKQVDRLKKMFEPKQAAAPSQPTAPKTDSSVDAPVSRAAVQADAPSPTAAPAWSPNPFRADDPKPTNEPDLVQQLSSTLIGITPEALQPVTREGVEAGYRVSQMVPWLNIVVPATKIIPNLSPALQSDPAGLRARQVIVNQLLITTQPGSLAFYGYDEVADLLNVEYPADDLKQQAFVTAWNILDPFQLAHVSGESGIDRTYAV